MRKKIIIAIVLFVVLAVAIAISIKCMFVAEMRLLNNTIWYCEELQLQISFNRDYFSHIVVAGNRYRCEASYRFGTDHVSVYLGEDSPNYKLAECAFSGKYVSRDDGKLILRGDDGKKYTFVQVGVSDAIPWELVYVEIYCPREGYVVFRNGDANVAHALIQRELDAIIDIFQDKKKYSDTPSCGFTENVSIQFKDGDGTQTFCVACDGCPVIYWKEEDRYFQITEEEKNELYSLLEEYGFYFPCV